MASYQWIKLYDEILDDPKMGRLSDGAYRFCINLFLLASRQEARDGSLPDMCDIAWVLRLDEKTATSHLEELVKAEIVASEGGKVAVKNFSARQGRIEPAERMKQHRGRKQKAGAGNKPVSPEETAALHGSYDDVTQRNTDIDKIRLDQTRKEKEYIEPLPDSVSLMISAIAGISGTTYADGINGKEFEEAAYALIGNDITPQDVEKFGEWWSSGNGFYANPPAIKTIVGKIRGTKLSGWIQRQRTGNNYNGVSEPGSDEVWKRITAAASRNSFADCSEGEKAAVRAAGGVQTIRMRTTDNEPKIKAAFFGALHEQQRTPA